MQPHLLNYKEIISSDIDRVTRTRELSRLLRGILAENIERQMDYNDAKDKIEEYLNINKQIRLFGKRKKECFITFTIDKLREQINDFEDYVYHLELVLVKMINLGLLYKITNEFDNLNEDFDLSALFILHDEAKVLFDKIMENGDNGGEWDIYKKTNVGKTFYKYNTNGEFGYERVVDKEELNRVIPAMIELTYSESKSGAADFILVKDGLLGWQDKKFYV